jgi:hypothetical protein
LYKYFAPVNTGAFFMGIGIFFFTPVITGADFLKIFSEIKFTLGSFPSAILLC